MGGDLSHSKKKTLFQSINQCLYLLPMEQMLCDNSGINYLNQSIKWNQMHTINQRHSFFPPKRQLDDISLASGQLLLHYFRLQSPVDLLVSLLLCYPPLFPPSHCRKTLKLQSPEQLQTSWCCSLSRRHRHTRACNVSFATLCGDRCRAKVHSITPLTTSSSPPLSFPRSLCSL